MIQNCVLLFHLKINNIIGKQKTIYVKFTRNLYLFLWFYFSGNESLVNFMILSTIGNAYAYWLTSNG